MNSKVIEKLIYNPAARFDDRLRDSKVVVWDLFYQGDQLEHLALSKDEQGQIGGHTAVVKGDQVFLDDETEAINDQERPDWYVIKRADLHTYTFKATTDIYVFQKYFSDIQFPTPMLTRIDRKAGRIDIFPYGAKVYVNNRAVDHQTYPWRVGQIWDFDGILVEPREEFWKITPLRKGAKINLAHFALTTDAREYPEDFPDFRRSPRIFLRQPESKVKVANVPQDQQMPKNSIMQMILPPVGMIVMYALLAYLMGNNSYMMIGMGGITLLTSGFSVSNYFSQKKEIKAKNKRAADTYQDYLLDTVGTINRLRSSQKKALTYNFPTIETLSSWMHHYNSRLYERMMVHEDFLAVSLGHGTVPASYQLDYDVKAGQVRSDEEKRVEEQIVKPFRVLHDAPIPVSLRQATLGLAGPDAVLRTSLQTLLFQIASFHSYHDVQFVAVLNEQEYKAHWHEWRWLPHFQLSDINLRGVVYNSQTRDMVLNSVYQLLVQRRQAVQEYAMQDGDLFKPHLVLVIQDETWLNGHNLNEFLNEDLSPYGVTVIWAKETANALPETVTTLVEYRSSKLATLVNQDHVYKDLDFEPNPAPVKYSMDDSIKRLANLNHIEVEKNSIPDSITFLELYGVKHVEELNVLKRWAQADTSKTLAVPLGMRGKDDVVDLNLHERAHGPHGLIAGTTGSGKSELLQSYILSLAVNFAPEDVGFLPIDYKGGGMANLFAKLPHLMGMITNLDGAATDRALKSIHAELQRRQRYFREFGVNNINGYTKLYKEGKQYPDDQQYPREPLPHLFLISDEFAELKANEPDFMDELVSTARIGRSLGVHLILATQKPSGVVNDQIWSNSRFKIALKVSEPADSKEIIHTPDAATITQVGRAYLQVGNNEIYELFQSAYSSADYEPDDDSANQVDNRIWLINHLGQAELLTRDLSEDDGSVNDGQTQLEAVVDEIAKNTKEAQAKIPMKPWLPPLKESLAGPDINWQESWTTDRTLTVPFGELDIPSHQEQKQLDFDLAKFNPTLIVGSAGYGKSVALQTIITNLAKTNNPEQVQFYLLDFGTNGLLPLVGLPHVGDIAGFDNLEKLGKLLKKLSKLVDDRKATFQDKGVSNLAQYEELTGESLPVTVVAIDAYDTVVENDDQRNGIDLVITKLLREGQALGIYTIMTANRYNSFRIGITSNITTRIGLYMVDDNAPRDMLGREVLKQSPIPGRGQLEVDGEMLAFQIYTPSEHNDFLKIVQDLRQLGKVMSEAWQGKVPEKVAMLPREIMADKAFSDQRVLNLLNHRNILLGYDKESAEPVGVDLTENGFFTIFSDNYVQDERILATVKRSFNQLKGVTRYLVKTSEDEVPYGPNTFDQVIDKKGIVAFFNTIKQESQKRKINQDRSPIYILVVNAHLLGAILGQNEDDFRNLLLTAKQVGIDFFMIGSFKSFIANYGGVDKALKNSTMVGALGVRFHDQSIAKVNSKYSEPAMKEDELSYFDGMTGLRIRLLTE
ncbi:type VII secretion protein EssC [Limosilactobacillus fermentum]|uniref:type VII secretion protein EssC n=1 Tax=Limosilactobacillus fermentum TaxID=1613 RepID=UPI0037C197F7